MARIRTIKPEFFEDEALAKLTAHERLLFIGTWLLADKNGVLEYRPEWIKAKVFPYENGETVDVSRMLPRLVSGGYLVRYRVDGREYLAVRNFSKHQRITGKEAQGEGRYPLPPDDICKEHQPGNAGEAPEKHPDAQEQGTGNREQGTGNEVHSHAGKPATPTPKPAKHRRLTPVRDNPPTIQEVCDYANERVAAGFGTLNPNEFFNRNEAAGWVHGRNGSKDVVDWRAHYRAWDKPAPPEDTTGGYTQEQLDLIREVEAEAQAVEAAERAKAGGAA